MINTDNIKEIRRKSGKSQNEMADLLNVSKSSYAMWESNNEIFPIKRLIRFCETFGVSLDYALGLSNNSCNVTSKFDIEKSALRIKMFRKDNNLTQEKLAKFLKTSKSVISAYEKGKNIIATPFLYIICKEFNISADYLLGRD